MRSFLANWIWLLLFGALGIGFVFGGWSASNQIPTQQQSQRPGAAHDKPETQPTAISEPHSEQGHAQAGEKKEPHGGGFWAWVSNFFEVKLTDLLIAVFTVVLALKTSGLFKETGGLREATFKLYDAGERQLEFLKENSATQSRDTQDSIAVARRSAEAAMKAAETAEKALFLEQRPWLHWKFPGALKGYKSGRHIRVDVEAVLENTGKTPAANVLLSARLFNVGRREPVINAGWVHQDELAEEYKSAQFTITTIMPGKEHGLSAAPTIEIAKLLGAEGDKGAPFELYLVFHIGYRMFDGSIIGGASSICKLGAVVPSVVVTQVPNSEDKLLEVGFTLDLFERNKVLPLVMLEMPVSRRVT